MKIRIEYTVTRDDLITATLSVIDDNVIMVKRDVVLERLRELIVTPGYAVTKNHRYYEQAARIVDKLFKDDL